MKNLNGKIVFITGAARGIGYSIAETFAKEGANIIIADVIKDLAKESAKKIEEDYHVKASAYEMDVNNCASIEKVFSEVEKEYGSLDVMVNNAGVQIRNPSKIFKEKDCRITSYNVCYTKLLRIHQKKIRIDRERTSYDNALLHTYRHLPRICITKVF